MTTFLTPVDLTKQELRNPRLQNLGSDIDNPVDGLFFYRSDTHKFRVRINGSWEDMATMSDVTAGGLSESLFDAKGDLLTADGDDSAVRKAVGANGTFLSPNSGETDGLEWRALVAGDIPDITLSKITDAGTAASEDASAFDAAGTASDAVSTHEGAADPHEDYLLEADHDKAAHDALGIDAATLDGNAPSDFEDAGAAASAISTHESAADPHSDYQLESEKGSADGYASLDSGGRVPSNQLPAIALSEIHVVADITERDGLTVQEGDTAIVQDNGDGDAETFLYDGTDWQSMASPTGGVSEVTATGYISSTGGETPEIAWAGTELAVADGGTGATDASGARSNLGATTKHSEDIGDGSATEFTVTHNLGTRAVTVEVFRNSSPWDTVGVDIERPSTSAVLIRVSEAPSTDEFTVVVVG